MKIRGMTILLIACLVEGCAYGVRHDYRSVPPHLEAPKSSLAVGVHDQRPYVVSGSKHPNVVGLSRGGYGNPFDVKTESGAPLADDFALAIQSALGPGTAQAVSIHPSFSRGQGIMVLQQTGADRLLLMTLHEWKSDTYNNTSLLYDVTLEAMDADGKVLAKEQFAGEDNLGGGFWNPPGHSRSAVPQAFRRKLEEFFASPQITAALNKDSDSRPASSGRPSGVSTADRLRELEELRTEGLVSPEEYEKKRTEILGDL